MNIVVFYSIIIPTWNRSDLLRTTLESICELIFQQSEFEVIVVDNGSTDRTLQVAREFQDKITNFHYSFNETPGLHVARHTGLKEAEGEVITFIDDDIQVFPDWLKGISESFQNPKIVLVGGNNYPKFEISPPNWVDSLWKQTQWGKALGTYSLIDFGNVPKEIPPEYVWGCNFSIRKDVLIKVGGFHPDAMPEELLKYRGDGETAVSRAISKKGYFAFFNPNVSIFHLISKSRLSYKYIYNRSFAQGISDSYTYIRERKKITKKDDFFSLLHKYTSIVKRSFKMASKVQKTLARGYWNGYRFHQAQVRKEPILLDWITKPDYFD